MKQVFIVGAGKEAVRCCGLFGKYGFEVSGLVGKRNGEAPGGIGIAKFDKDCAGDIASEGCPIVFAGGQYEFSQSCQTCQGSRYIVTVF